MATHPRMPERHAVLISRRWEAAEIKIDVTTDGIQVGMQLNDFLDALVDEIGRPTFVLTSAQLRERMHAASAAVCLDMKRETRRIV